MELLCIYWFLVLRIEILLFCNVLLNTLILISFNKFNFFFWINNALFSITNVRLQIFNFFIDFNQTHIILILLCLRRSQILIIEMIIISHFWFVVFFLYKLRIINWYKLLNLNYFLQIILHNARVLNLRDWRIINWIESILLLLRLVWLL